VFLPLIHLPGYWSILLDVAVWAVIHLVVALLSIRMPLRMFTRDASLYRTRAWEDCGRVYQRVFRIRRWKHRLPDGGSWFKNGFAKKQLTGRDAAYFALFAAESRRAEWTHWLCIPPAMLFFLWNPVPVGFVMILYAFVVNLPCILAQRFNRPRLETMERRLSDMHSR
jgi:glycosyl-4,4'-diaponeurosporenoate acyltransferase